MDIQRISKLKELSPTRFIEKVNDFDSLVDNNLNIIISPELKLKFVEIINQIIITTDKNNNFYIYNINGELLKETIYEKKHRHKHYIQIISKDILAILLPGDSFNKIIILVIKNNQLIKEFNFDSINKSYWLYKFEYFTLNETIYFPIKNKNKPYDRNSNGRIYTDYMYDLYDSDFNLIENIEFKEYKTSIGEYFYKTYGYEHDERAIEYLLKNSIIIDNKIYYNKFKDYIEISNNLHLNYKNKQINIVKHINVNDIKIIDKNNNVVFDPNIQSMIYISKNNDRADGATRIHHKPQLTILDNWMSFQEFDSKFNENISNIKKYDDSDDDE